MKHIHLNLINEEEVLSSSPVRTQTIAPVVVLVISLSTALWWLLLFTNHSALKKLNISHIEANQQLQPAYTHVKDLTAQEKELTALNAQLKAFEHSRITYGKVFSSIPKHVNPNVQFTILEVSPPPTPMFDEKNREIGPTNTFESAQFSITGKTIGANAFDAVDQLLKSLQSDSYSNLVQSAHIPKGSFRQDNSSRNNKDALRFEIKCICRPRRFK